MPLSSPRSHFLSIAALTLLGAPFAYWSMFGGFAAYDDEGYFTLAVRQVLDGMDLYDEVLAQHGPFFFEFWGLAFGVPGIEVSPNAVRGAVLLLWLLTAFGCGVAALRLTRSLAAAAVAVLTALLLNVALATEPLHPGSLIELLLIGIVVALTAIERRPRAAFAIAGLIAGCLVMVKINVGGFACIGLLYGALVATSAGTAGWRAVQAVGGLMITVPVLLMLPDLEASGFQTFAALIALSAAAVVIVTIPPRDQRVEEPARALPAVLVGAATAAVAVCALAALALGTGPLRVAESVLIDAADQRNILSNPLEMPAELADFGLVAVVIAAALRLSGRLSRMATAPSAADGWLRIAAGIAIVLTVVGGSPFTGIVDPKVFGVAAPLAFVAALPAPGVAPRLRVARITVAAVAVLQPLHAYPVAGSQLRFGSLLFAVIAAICLRDGIALLQLRGSHDAARRFSAIAAAGLVVALGVKVGAENLGRQTQSAGDAYADRVALPFDGADRIRLSTDEVGQFRAVVEGIRRHCSTVQTLPGMSSLNLWSYVPPPTGLNAPSWMYLLDDQRQRRIVAALDAADRPCVVRNEALLSSVQRRPLPDRSLLRQIRTRYRIVESYGTYQLLVPAGS